MGKVIRALTIVAAIAVNVIPGIGQVLSATMIAGITAAGVAAGLSVVGGLFGPKVPRSQLSRLNVSLDPSAPRKAVLGTTAMPLDLRYHEASGSDQEYIDYIIAVAAHKVASIDEIWFEQRLAWSAAGGVTSTYTGYLTVATRTEGTAANAIAINSGAVWGSDCRLTGCAYVHIRIKRTGENRRTESPLVQGLPSRITIIGEGALLYDPRQDSTVAGGSGSHRADDQDTWGTYVGSDDYDNPALQLLWYLLGWKINGKLSIGAGVPPARIDLESFITAANICDEDITLATGGTQKRYRTSGTVSDEDARMDAVNTYLACMNGTLRDSGGKLTLALLKNDLADPMLAFTDGDFLGEFAWDQTGGGLAQGHNLIRGRFVDPSEESLYQLVEYPEVAIDSPDGIERVMTFDLPYVEDARRAQRLAKQVLQRHQFRGQLSAEFSAKALGCEVGDIVTVTLEALAFNSKPFRVIGKEVRADGRVPLQLLEESALIYQWDKEDRAPVVPRTPITYDPLKNLMTQGDEDAATSWVTFSEVDPVSIQADSSGITTTSLPVSRGIRVYRGGVEQTSGVTLGTVTATSGITASASITSGAVTVSISAANVSGFVNVPVIYDGTTYDRLIVVNRQLAAPIVGGSAGSGSFTDQIWTNINSTSFVQVTDTGAQIQSNASGEIRLSASAGYTGSGVAEIKTQYSADGVSWTDVASATGSVADDSDPFEPLDGYVSVGPTTKTGLSASTNYYVRLVARRTSSGGTLSWAGPSFTATAP